jgi:hypothetical protein
MDLVGFGKHTFCRENTCFPVKKKNLFSRKLVSEKKTREKNKTAAKTLVLLFFCRHVA